MAQGGVDVWAIDIVENELAQTVRLCAEASDGTSGNRHNRVVDICQPEAALVTATVVVCDL